MIALYAHVNDYALFYCPLARSFISDPAEYFFDAFRAQNAQLIEKDDGLGAKFEDFDNERTPEAVIRFMRVLSRRDEPVFSMNTMNCSNQWFVTDFQINSPNQLPVIREFVNWTVAVAGKRSFAL